MMDKNTLYEESYVVTSEVDCYNVAIIQFKIKTEDIEKF